MPGEDADELRSERMNQTHHLSPGGEARLTVLPEIRILSAGSLVDVFANLFQIAARHGLLGLAHVNVLRCERMGDLMQALRRQPFHLVLLHTYVNDGPLYEELEAAGRVDHWLQHGGERGSEYVSLQGKALIGILAHMWGLPVFVLDTAGLDADAVRAAGASEFLRLPFTFETLVAAMRRQLGWGIADSAFAWWRGLASTSGAVGGRPSRL